MSRSKLQAAARLLRKLGGILAALYLVAAWALWFFQDRFLFHPKPYAASALTQVEERGGRRLVVTTSQGRQVAFYKPPREHGAEAPAFVWFVFPGRGSLALDYWGHTSYWDRRFAYVFVDYPGYGLCEGQPSTAPIGESVSAIAAELCRALGWTENDLRQHAGVLGHSMGCAAALQAADHLRLSRAVICAPFTSLQAMAQHVVGWPLCYLQRQSFDNVERIAALEASGIAAQIRVFHGTNDHTIPVEMSRSLADRFPKTVQLTLAPGATHGGIMLDAREKIGRAMQELAGLHGDR